MLVLLVVVVAEVAILVLGGGPGSEFATLPGLALNKQKLVYLKFHHACIAMEQGKLGALCRRKNGECFGKFWCMP